jgi:DNA-binding NtrC family response regulator
MPIELQAKLLRLLEERCYRPLGGATANTLGCRIIAATNANLEERVRQGRFRLDLLHRLGGITLHAPPLADRPSDIGLLIDTFAARHGAAGAFAPDAVSALVQRQWPGNVRQLSAYVQQALLFVDDRPIRASHLAADDGDNGDVHRRIAEMIYFLDANPTENMKLVADELWRLAFKKEGGLRAAARRLGVDHKALARRLLKADERARVRRQEAS